MKKYLIITLIGAALASAFAPAAKAATNTWTGDNIFEGDVDIGSWGSPGDLSVPYGTAFLGTGASVANERLYIKAKGASSGLAVTIVNSLGVPTFTIADWGNMELKTGYVLMRNPYNDRTFEIDTVQGRIEHSWCLFLNKNSISDTIINFGGGRTAVGGTTVWDAGLTVHTRATAWTYETALRVIGKADHLGNFIEAQSVTGTKLFVVNYAGKVGVGTEAPTANLDVKGTVKFERQGDILMGEFGNP